MAESNSSKRMGKIKNSNTNDSNNINIYRYKFVWKIYTRRYNGFIFSNKCNSNDDDDDLCYSNHFFRLGLYKKWKRTLCEQLGTVPNCAFGTICTSPLK